MKIAKTIGIPSALLSMSLSLFAGVAAADEIVSNQQINAGPITAGITLQNVVVPGVAELNSTAMGNFIGGALQNVSSNKQDNSGTINASASIIGPATTIGTLLVKATAVGNNIGSAVNESAISTVRIANNTQSNTGAVGASVTWNFDPTNGANLSALAVGNMTSINIAK